MNAARWTPEHRDALLARVGVVTAGTAVAGCVGAVGLAVGLSATAQAATTHKAAGTSTATAPRVSSGTTGGSSTGVSSTTVAPAQVQVEILNGVGIAGAAHLVADQLRSAGFDVVGIGNAPRIMPQSGIVYAQDQVKAFRTLSRATGVTLSSTQGTGSALILVVGQDWQGQLPAAAPQVAPQSGPQAAPRSGGSVATSGGS